jgi:asparagine synthase (glutamine-hydrolysing)
MCGIAGILSTAMRTPELEAPLRSMQAALRHRGPDDQGIFLAKSKEQGAGSVTCGFVHTRLAIIDLSPAGHQPMATPDGRFTIVFNGEIYNFRELRQQLVADGASFQSHSDTEVILRLYERHSEDCVERLRGMFAFAIWDEREKTCFLARDPLGIKPLYFAQFAGCLIFASELRALLASGLVAKQLDPASVFGFFQTGSVPEPGTLIRGVRLLPAGSSLLWTNGETTPRSHWRIDFAGRAGAGANGTPQVREALLDSVRRHFVSDVPVGVFLSGGIDSTAIVALSRVVGQADLRTLSISFKEPEFNEGDVARQTAAHFKTRQADCRLEASAGKKLFEEFLQNLDQPSIDGFNTFTVSRFAREQGIKVVLSGLGGDELFGGYPTFQKVPRMVNWSRRLGVLPPVRSLAGSLLQKSGRPQWRRLGGFLHQRPTMGAAYRTFRGVFAEHEARMLAAKFAQVSLESVSEPPLDLPEQPTPEDEVSAMELELYMRNQLLRDGDVMSMASGLELRVPFVDQALVESVAGVPASLRLRPGKRMLLDAVPEVPAWVSERPKRGFQFPFQQWIEGDWREVFAAVVTRSGCRAQTWYQQWALFVFANWCQRHGIQA